NLGRELPSALASRYETFVARRERREPLQHILGWEEFCGLRFTVTADVLVPRPETETLVEWALALLLPAGAGGKSVIDVRTGSGCISGPRPVGGAPPPGLAAGVAAFAALRGRVAAAPAGLRPAGTLALETAGGAHVTETAALMSTAGFVNISTRRDLA